MKHIKYDQEFIEPKYYPDVRILDLEKITDETLADFFEFTKEECEIIDATDYPRRIYSFKEITCGELRKEKEEPAEESRANARRRTRKLHRFF